MSKRKKSAMNEKIDETSRRKTLDERKVEALERIADSLEGFASILPGVINALALEMLDVDDEDLNCDCEEKYIVGERDTEEILKDDKKVN